MTKNYLSNLRVCFDIQLDKSAVEWCGNTVFHLHQETSIFVEIKQIQATFMTLSMNSIAPCGTCCPSVPFTCTTMPANGATTRVAAICFLLPPLAFQEADF